MKKRKIRVSSILFALLLLAGLGVLLYPTASDWYTRWQISRELSSYAQIAEAEQTDYSEMWEAAEAYNRSLLEKGSQFWTDAEEKAYVATLLNPLGTGMMGRIEIPKINVDLPIYQGTEEQQLQSGAGYWIGSSLPTGGESTHCVITAHTGLVKAKLFTDLDQMEEGDRFFLHVLDRDMAYEVDQILIAEPEDMSALSVVEGKDYVTLYTCYPYGVNTQRLLVRGHRVEMEEEAVEAAEKAERRFPWWILVPAGILAALWAVYRKKRKKYVPNHAMKQENKQGKRSE